jgi:cytoskeletal protein RodZ
MGLFKQKKLESSSKLGDKLKQLRKEKGWSIKNLAKKTKLEEDYIIAIETSAVHNLPEGKMYKKLFVKRYLSAFEQTDTQEYLEEFEQSFTTNEAPKKNSNKQSYFQNIPTIFRLGFVMLLVLSFVGYFGLQIKQLLDPPKLSVATPKVSHTTNQKQIKVKGSTNPEASVIINGKPVSHTKNGKFSKQIQLKNGLNTLVIKAKTDHSEAKTITRQVVFEQEAKFSMNKDKETKS